MFFKLLLLVIFSLAMTLQSFSKDGKLNALSQHFLGENPVCVKQNVPTLIVTDVTVKGEVDDTFSLYIYSRLEKLRCIKVIGVVSMFGNNNSSTTKVHQNLKKRLFDLKINHWKVMEGPSNRFSVQKDSLLEDMSKLEFIANTINSYDNLVIVELGPWTVSASLFKYKLVSQKRISKILGIGGRLSGEHFSVAKYIPFAFRDMNVAEDRAAIAYLLQNYPQKLWMVTYKTGLGDRMVIPDSVDSLKNESLSKHARHRAKILSLIGYEGKIPSWDTWTSNWFIKRGGDKLGCKSTFAKMQYAEGYRPSDSMQMQIGLSKGHKITACH